MEGADRMPNKVKGNGKAHKGTVSFQKVFRIVFSSMWEHCPPLECSCSFFAMNFLRRGASL